MALTKEFIEAISTFAWQAEPLRFAICNGTWLEANATAAQVLSSETGKERPLITVTTNWDASNNRQLLTFSKTGFLSSINAQANALAILRGYDVSPYGFFTPIAYNEYSFTLSTSDRALDPVPFAGGDKIAIANAIYTVTGVFSGVVNFTPYLPAGTVVNKVSNANGVVAPFKLANTLLIPQHSPILLTVSGESRPL